jgi:ferrous iron transport protein A
MQMSHALSLDRLPVGRIARITSIDWAQLDPSEARRLREFGLYEGMEIEMLHRGTILFRDPLAVRIGRMRVAIRSVHAAAVSLELVDAVVAGESSSPSTGVDAA